MTKKYELEDYRPFFSEWKSGYDLNTYNMLISNLKKDSYSIDTIGNLVDILQDYVYDTNICDNSNFSENEYFVNKREVLEAIIYIIQ